MGSRSQDQCKIDDANTLHLHAIFENDLRVCNHFIFFCWWSSLGWTHDLQLGDGHAQHDGQMRCPRECSALSKSQRRRSRLRQIRNFSKQSGFPKCSYPWVKPRYHRRSSLEHSTHGLRRTSQRRPRRSIHVPNLRATRRCPINAVAGQLRR